LKVTSATTHEENPMSNGGRKHTGPGTQGKGAGVGGMTDGHPEQLQENMILSNRDKAQHTKERGLDSRWVRSEQHEHE
jgi:hypothetical protein